MNHRELIIKRSIAITDLAEITRKRVGFRAERRIKKLASYKKQWDGDEAKILSIDSATLTAGFLNYVKEFPTTPSFFLTLEGHMALSWEQENGESVNIVFQESSCRVNRNELVHEYLISSPLALQSVARVLMG